MSMTMASKIANFQGQCIEKYLPDAVKTMGLP